MSHEITKTSGGYDITLTRGDSLFLEVGLTKMMSLIFLRQVLG